MKSDNAIILETTPWSDEIQVLEKRLNVNLETGLSKDEVESRQLKFGLNKLREIEPRSLGVIFLNQIKSFVVLLLFAACIVSFSFGEVLQGSAIFIVVVINTLIGFFTEWRAIRSMEALRELGEVSTTVRRSGKVSVIAAHEMVPGDIVIFEGGDVISADIRLFNASNLQADESVLTGEAIPVSKTIDTLLKDTHLSERDNMLHKGTAITRGSGVGIVVGTGFNTQLGQVAKLVSAAKNKNTPLEKKLANLARQLVYFTLIIVTLIAIAGIVTGREVVLAIEIAVALAVAAIPEGLPIVATIALATGLHKLAKRQALINRLSAVETLGATNVIISDKTGTLTENQMTLSRIELEGQSLVLTGTGLDTTGDVFNSEDEQHETPINNTQAIDELLKVIVLCNNASLFIKAENEPEIIGDPTETALLIAGLKRNIQQAELLQLMPEAREEAFNSESKKMATFHSQHNKSDFFVAVKGAPEAILDVCNYIQIQTDTQGSGEKKIQQFNQEQKEQWLKKSSALASQGLRILAVAQKHTENLSDEPYENLIFLGLIGLVDPPRAGVKEAIGACYTAGIKVVMVTGDHPATALRVGSKLGITQGEITQQVAEQDISKSSELEHDAVVDLRTWKDDEDLSLHPELLKTRIFARATPRQKQQLIQLHQSKKNIVAMTGDGINDAPALKLADIGIAMGQRGTQVAKEASAMILLDDAFSSIVDAIKQGRVIYNNIQKFVIYLLSCNLSEILIIGLATFLNTPLPLLPLQILFLNLVTDVFPALALGVSPGFNSILEKKPRLPSKHFLSQKKWLLIFLYGAAIAGIVLLSMYIAINILKLSDNQAVTIAFLTLAFTQLWHVFNLREESKRWFKNEITYNSWIWFALILCIVLILSAVYIPIISTVLKIQPPNADSWVLILGMSVTILFIAPLIRASVNKN